MHEKKKVKFELLKSEAEDLLWKLKTGDPGDEARETLFERLWEAVHESSFQEV